ncbi:MULTISPECIES: NADH-quinone oxidoreductase subunit G [unclassified Luteococcus]|uniref:NADH-quinone oxidoreductase subunit G n=1 Tax=unclassified Luteococcus TaxID=2639923 RepID=UPI00313C55B5
MSVDTNKTAPVAKPDEVTFTIDGIEMSAPKGTLILRAAETVGIEIPRFCDHPLLDPAGACRQCMVDIPDGGNGRPMKPSAACTTTVMPGMKVNTAATSEVVAKAQEGMLEFLLINHPLDCPICDKGGECPLQNQAMSHGRGESRYEGAKRTFAKPIDISKLVLLDRERCVLCQRCTRFSAQISGDPFINLQERGAFSQINTDGEHAYDSYFSGNVIQICPVGALTSADYRFQSRPFDLVSTETSCEHCAAGCALRTDHRHYQVKRRLAGLDPQVNEEWNCDKGRFAFRYGRGTDRLETPLVRRDGKLVPASWHEAIDAAVTGLQRAEGRVGVLTGGRLLTETAYAYGRFARGVLGTNNIDFRSRPLSGEEADFLAARVAGRTLDESVTYADLEKAKRVVLVGFEPEDESPIIFLRLRKAFRKNKLEVLAVGSHLSNGSRKMGATLVPALPGQEALAVQALPQQTELGADTIILVGERAGQSAGTLTAVAQLADATGARLAWIPRRAGDLGAIEAGCLPNLLPGGRPLADATARVDLQAAWGVEHLNAEPGLDAEQMLAAAASGELQALVVSGVQLSDLADPAGARAAVEQAGFVVSLEQRLSEVSERADVVFPVALLEEQSGSFLNWEHRVRPVAVVNRQNNAPMTEIRVLAALADALGSDLGVRTASAAGRELAELGDWEGARAVLAPAAAAPADNGAGVLVDSWRLLLDASAGVDGANHLMDVAPPAVARVSVNTAAQHGLSHGGTVTVRGASGSAQLPVWVETQMVDDVVWLPANLAPVSNEALAAPAGSRVMLEARPAGAAGSELVGGVA